MLTVTKKEIQFDKKSKKKGKPRPKASGPSSAGIYANRLIVQAKHFHTKPVMKKYPISKESVADTSSKPTSAGGIICANEIDQ